MAKKRVVISATEKLINSIADKVAKTFGFKGGNGLIIDPPTAEGEAVNIALDMDYIKKEVGSGGAGGDTYDFVGDDYIQVSVSDEA